MKGLEYTKQVMHNAIVHHSPTNAQLVPKQRSLPAPIPPVYILDVMSCGMGYPFGQFGSAAPAVSQKLGELLVLLQPSCWLGMRS